MSDKTQTTPQLSSIPSICAMQLEILSHCKLWQNDAFDAAAKLADGWGDEPKFKALAASIRSLKHAGTF